MLFSSWNFIVYFLPAALLGFYLIPTSFAVVRKVWLIAASLFFYGYWKIDYVPLLLLSILVNYGVAEGIVRRAGSAGPRLFLIAGISFNLILLGYFKYTNFGITFLSWIIQRDIGAFNIILPLAISFFTFTQISYIVDVYRDRHVHYRFLDYILFVVFFPHLIAGPIVRHWEIIPQFASREFRVNRDNFGIGVTLFILGLIKKCLADSVAFEANAVFNGAAAGTALSSLDAWIGTLAFALQIYFDFSSYSDMAIGLARMFGIKFPFNFDSPYRATSVIVFWERWHRTLTRFLREYVYFGLGGNRRGHFRQVLNIMATMLLSGLWHGAGWTFVIWGGVHGFYLVINHQWRLWLKRMNWSPIHWLYRGTAASLTFLVVTLAWIFFRSSSLGVAGKMFSHMLGVGGFSLPDQLFGPGSLRDGLLTKLGFHFVETSDLMIKHYEGAGGKIIGLLLFCWLLPNTQQLLAKYQPVLEPVTRTPPFYLKLGLASGVALGFIGFLLLRNCYVTAPTPFIYFHF